MSDAKFGFDYCALQYLNMWLESEQAQHNDLANGVADEKRKALASFATDYGIARTLPKLHDVGQRCQPVLDILDTLNPEKFEGDTPWEAVKEVESKISAAYGKRGVLSATTKFLWLKFRSPIIIYDRQARDALGTKDGNIEAFYVKWREEYLKNESNIEAACNSLRDTNYHKYTIGTVVEIERVVSDKWFQERVFDIYLWHVGAASGALSQVAGKRSPV